MNEMERQIQEMETVLGDKVRRAFALAEEVHRPQKRKSGEPYIIHPVAVAYILFKMGADQDVICAALLHDTIEEAKEANGQERIDNKIYAEFGDQVLYLVQAVSKDGKILDKDKQQEAYFLQIQNAFEVDIFVFFIKVADLLHNLSTIFALSPERKARWIHELKYQYLPIFSEYFHRIPFHYHDMYHQMLNSIQELIDSNDT